ncbi:hypothetical protein L596_019871 [Steinernema carpocapsae]|uniref:RRM domain-containing protein n=1 Tax=Steinernema carpocapsae TaxID=34508 RepID=A0A4U5MS05_STECR|nr:hypothetical protein L596_019871 [Steinernema carpocapsae]
MYADQIHSEVRSENGNRPNQAHRPQRRGPRCGPRGLQPRFDQAKETLRTFSKDSEVSSRALRTQKNFQTASPTSVAHIYVSNLAYSVSTADLKELFERFHPSKVQVHFNEHGNSLGTADVLLRSGAAEALMAEFYEVALDNREIKMVLVNHPPVQNRIPGPTEQRVPIQNRISNVKDHKEQPLRRKVEQCVEGRRSPNAENQVSGIFGLEKKNNDRRGSRKTPSPVKPVEKENVSPTTKEQETQAKDKKPKPNPRRERKPKKTNEELDRDIETFRKGSPNSAFKETVQEPEQVVPEAPRSPEVTKEASYPVDPSFFNEITHTGDWADIMNEAD